MASNFASDGVWHLNCYFHQVRKTKLSNSVSNSSFYQFHLGEALTRIVIQMGTRMLIAGKIVFSISSELSSVSCEHRVSFGCLDR